VAERARVFSRHMDYMEAHTPPKKLVHELRKAVAWYTRGLHGSAEVRSRAFDLRDPAQVREIALGYFSSLVQEKNSDASTVDKVARQVA
jgi:tRNA-dihydrouridine synthase B